MATNPTRRVPGGPVFDNDLYSIATLRVEAQARGQIAKHIDTLGLSEWFGHQLREAYNAGLHDGYVQGRHDKHNAPTPAHTDPT